MTSDTEDQNRIVASLLLIRIVLGFIVFTGLILVILPYSGLIKVVPESLGTAPVFADIFLLLSFFLVIFGFTARKLLSRVQKKEDKQVHISACLQATHISHLVAFACFEAIAVIGFVSFMISGDPESSLIFSITSLSCMLYAWPRMSQLRKMIDPGKSS